MTSFSTSAYIDKPPDSLVDSDVLPSFTLDNVFAIAALRSSTSGQQYSALGVVSAIFNDDDEILMIEHNASDKYPRGALGPLAETSAAFVTGHLVRVENTVQTFARALHEELNVQDQADFTISSTTRPWLPFDWPTGINRPHESRRAICPVLRCSDPQDLIANVSHNDEVLDANFYPVQAVHDANLLRLGVADWLHSITTSEAYRTLPYSDDADAKHVTVDATPAPQEQIDLVFCSDEFLALSRKYLLRHG